MEESQMLIKEQNESGHWYTKDGEPAYTIEGKSGKRATTLRDAKKLGLLPSVTTILNVAAKPGLQTWLQHQAILSALTLPRQDNESEEDWLNRVTKDSKETGRKAAQRGTDIHDVVESFYEGMLLEAIPSYIHKVEETLNNAFGKNCAWMPEKSFSHELGYAGKVDLHCKAYAGFDGVVVDVKTKEGSLDKVTPYFENLMQLAAYKEGLSLPKARTANLYISTNGDVKLIEHSQEDMVDALKCFFHLLRFYQIKSKL